MKATDWKGPGGNAVEINSRQFCAFDCAPDGDKLVVNIELTQVYPWDGSHLVTYLTRIVAIVCPQDVQGNCRHFWSVVLAGRTTLELDARVGVLLSLGRS